VVAEEAREDGGKGLVLRLLDLSRKGLGGAAYLSGARRLLGGLLAFALHQIRQCYACATG
jgi:hypothetical protein